MTKVFGRSKRVELSEWSYRGGEICATARLPPVRTLVQCPHWVENRRSRLTAFDPKLP